MPSALLRSQRTALPDSTQPFHVLTHVTETGERIPVLIELRSGLPPVAALRYTLFRRGRPGASASLKVAVRCIRDLYEWYHITYDGRSLDALLHGGEMLTDDELRAALAFVSSTGLRSWERTQTVRRSKGVIGSITNEVPRVGAWLNNRRLSAWRHFLGWITDRRKWSDDKGMRSAVERRLWREQLIDIREFCDDPDNHQRSGRTVHHAPLSQEELETIDEAIAPDTDGAFPAVFTPATCLRNWCMYAVGRWGGLRRGESLKLKVGDIPTPVAGHGTPASPWEFSVSEIEVVRRPDDRMDSRVTDEPSVKRGGRGVTMPDDVLGDLYRYALSVHGRDLSLAHVSDRYLFVTEEGRPLSIGRADDVIEQIGRYASAAWQREHRAGVHTLDGLTWHRLRATRATELLPEFEASGINGVMEFCSYFGWVSMLSARPYLVELFRRRGKARVVSHLESLRTESALRRLLLSTRPKE